MKKCRRTSNCSTQPLQWDILNFIKFEFDLFLILESTRGACKKTCPRLFPLISKYIITSNFLPIERGRMNIIYTSNVRWTPVLFISWRVGSQTWIYSYVWSRTIISNLDCHESIFSLLPKHDKAHAYVPHVLFHLFLLFLIPLDDGWAINSCRRNLVRRRFG